tara:strand:- start:453 stop:644 length:192 start_codon:yes stop_codon:yes gene_type:complete
MTFTAFKNLYMSEAAKQTTVINVCEETSYVSNPRAIRQFAILRDKDGIDVAQVRKNGVVILFN